MRVIRDKFVSTLIEDQESASTSKEYAPYMQPPYQAQYSQEYDQINDYDDDDYTMQSDDDYYHTNLNSTNCTASFNKRPENSRLSSHIESQTYPALALRVDSPFTGPTAHTPKNFSSSRTNKEVHYPSKIPAPIPDILETFSQAERAKQAGLLRGSNPRNAHGICLRPVSSLRMLLRFSVSARPNFHSAADIYRGIFKFGVFNAVQSMCFDDVSTPSICVLSR